MNYFRDKSHFLVSLPLQCAPLAPPDVYRVMGRSNIVNSGFLGISPIIYLKTSLFLPRFLCLLALHANKILYKILIF